MCGSGPDPWAPLDGLGLLKALLPRDCDTASPSKTAQAHGDDPEAFGESSNFLLRVAGCRFPESKILSSYTARLASFGFGSA